MSSYAAAGRVYTEASVLTASPGQLVVMLYDGAVRYLAQATAALEANDRQRARERLRRAEAIVDELNLSLDMSQGALPEQLRALYLFVKAQMREATVAADPRPLRASLQLLRELREAWEQAASGVDAPAA